MPLPTSLETVSEQLEHKGYLVWPSFLSGNALQHTGSDFSAIPISGGFARARTGQGEQVSVRDLRRDEIHWLDRGSPNASQSLLWDKFDELQVELNRSLVLGLSSFEGHYASYGKGAFYHRHLDSFQSNKSRLVFFVMHLTENWAADQGGRLRIYGEGTHTDVDPTGGTIV